MCLLDHTFHSGSSDSQYELELSAWGNGVLREEGLLDMQKPDHIISSFKKKYRRYPRSISLLLKDPYEVGYDFGFTGIDSALLIKLKTLKELILPASVTNIELTPELEKLLKENSTLIRGSFGTFAESFASENGLHFRPADFIFAEYEFEPARESTRMVLLFKRNGGTEIKEIITAPGTNAGNTSGGTFYHSMSRNFYKTDTSEQIAGRFNPRLRDAIIEDGRLAEFIKQANEHNFYSGKN